MTLWVQFGSRCSRWFQITPSFINSLNLSDWHIMQKSILRTFRSWQLDVRVKTCSACQERGAICAKTPLHPKPRVISRRSSKNRPTLPLAALWALTCGRIEIALWPPNKAISYFGIFLIVMDTSDYKCLNESNMEADARDISTLRPLYEAAEFVWLAQHTDSNSAHFQVLATRHESKRCPACQERGAIRAKTLLHTKPPRNQ